MWKERFKETRKQRDKHNLVWEWYILKHLATLATGRR